MSEVNANVTAEQAVPETRNVIVYESEDIEEVLRILDRDTPVIGIAAMRQVCTVFDTLQTKGFVQQARTQYEDGSFPVANNDAPQFVGEGDVMYNAAEDVNQQEEIEHVDGEIVE